MQEHSEIKVIQSKVTLENAQPNQSDLFTQMNTNLFLSRNLNSFKWLNLNFQKSQILLTFTWIFLILMSGIFIGIAASNQYQVFQYSKICLGQSICKIGFTLTKIKANQDLFVYVKIDPYYQNTRYFKNGYNENQLNGFNYVNDTSMCGSYQILQNFNATTSSGGYLKSPLSAAIPCGFSMANILNDTFSIIDSSGSMVLVNTIITNNFYNGSQFKRAKNYLISQWLDVQDGRFMNWFTISSIWSKTQLVLKIDAFQIGNGNYSLIIKNNNYRDLTKSVIICTCNSMGNRDFTLGLSVLAFSIIVFIFSVYLCCKLQISTKI